MGAGREPPTSRWEKAAGNGRAVVLRPWLRSGKIPREQAQTGLAEGVGLAEAITLEVVMAEIVPIAKVKPATLLGSGSVDATGQFVSAQMIDLVIVDATLTPIQQRNLERAWKCKVIDRTSLILEIFGARARSREGQLQVELAALTYQRSRLVRSWTHLERQRGALGFIGGPGESQLEIDRRLIDNRITKLRRKLDQVRRTRTLHRAARARVPFPVVALVGYTNAGKSTLFNKLTSGEVFTHDQLFATLDPTMRSLTLPSGRAVILSDTVGFISDLPTDLIAAFSATLEEVLAADLIVHVRDISHPNHEAQKKDVEAVLADLDGSRRANGAELEDGGLDAPLEALNKIDRLSDTDRREVCEGAAGTRSAVAISAATGEGLEALCRAIEQLLSEAQEHIEVTVPLCDGANLAWLYRHGTVIERRDDDEKAHLRVRLDAADLDRLARRQGISVGG